MKLSLVVVNAGKASGQTIPIKISRFVIGRDPDCNLRPASAMISKKHCAVLVKNGKVTLRDFDSTNGTFLNDHQVRVQRQRDLGANGGDDRRTERKIRNEPVIHHIQVQPVSAGLLTATRLGPQLREIAGQDRRGDVDCHRLQYC